jgi:acetate kinase
MENAEITAYIRENMGAHPIFNHWLACETTFFIGLPEVASVYALPATLAGHEFFRFGANGLFHQWISQKCDAGERIVSVYLGDHPDTAAIANGKAVDSSSGYSLLEGIPGKSTCGELDPSIILLLAENGFSPQEIEETLYTRSGWQTVSGKATSYAQMVTAKGSGFDLAREINLRALIKSIGAMLATLGGAERIILGCESKKPFEGLFASIQNKLSFTSFNMELIEVKRKELIKSLLNYNL